MTQIKYSKLSILGLCKCILAIILPQPWNRTRQLNIYRLKHKNNQIITFKANYLPILNPCGNYSPRLLIVKGSLCPLVERI